jgi:hypothetical protein
MTDPNTPIVVNPDPIYAQLAIALRYTISTLGGYAAGKGWIDGDTVQMIVSIAAMLAPAIYAAWKARREKKALVTITQSAADSVAIVKGTSA